MLLIIFVQLKIEGKNFYVLYNLYKFFVLSTMFVITMEALGWVFDGRSGLAARVVATAANSLLLATNIIPLIVYTLFSDFKIYEDDKRIKKSLIPFTLILMANALFALSAPINKLYFYLDDNNLYHRGVLSIVTIILIFIIFLYNILLVLINWKRINQRNRFGMILTIIPPLIGFVLQMIFYGLSLAWAGVCLSILMVHITVQGETIKMDYLTGLYNRRQLDYYLNSEIQNLSKNKKLAGIMFDVDNFKQINDNYGHTQGDKAIEAVGTILKRFFNHGEFLARYAGDEFVILFEVDNEEALEKKVAGMKKELMMFNEKEKMPFKLQISIGYAIYKQESKQSSDDFLRHLDILMYKEKKSKKFKAKYMDMI